MIARLAPGRSRWRLAAATGLVLCTACSASTGAPPRLDAYDVLPGTSPWRLGVQVEGTVDLGGPNGTSALSQVVSTSGLKVSARMRVDYGQDVREAEGGGRSVEMHATAVSGRFQSFVANRDFGAGDLAAFGHDGTVTLHVGPDGTLHDVDGSPLGGLGLPVVGDVLTGWPCPPLPDTGAEPGVSWPVSVNAPGGTPMSGTATYEPGDLAGRHVLEVSADLEGDASATGVEIQKVVTTISEADLPDLHLSPMDVQAHVETRNRCRVDAVDRSLVNWSVDSSVDATLHATSTAKYDAILDETTMSLSVSATASPAG